MFEIPSNNYNLIKGYKKCRKNAIKMFEISSNIKNISPKLIKANKTMQ